jgi:hypothetical protein
LADICQPTPSSGLWSYEDGSVPGKLTSFFPKVSGCRMGFVSMAPDSDPPPKDFDPDKLPGLAAHYDPALPGMHTSATVDLSMIVSRSSLTTG